MTMLPAVLVALCPCCAAVVFALRKLVHSRVASSLIADRAADGIPSLVKEALLWSVKPMLYITFVAFPITASLAFQSFACESFDSGTQQYLRADYSVRCSRAGYTSQKHEDIMALAWLAIWIYPVGVPALYTLLLLSQRRALIDDRPTVLTKALSFLHKDYRKACYLWEVVEVHAPTHKRMPAARK